MEDWRIWRIIRGFARKRDGRFGKTVWLESLNNVPYPPFLHSSIITVEESRAETENPLSPLLVLLESDESPGIFEKTQKMKKRKTIKLITRICVFLV